MVSLLVCSRRFRPYLKLFTTRRIPSFNNDSLKFINKPSLSPLSFKYVTTCLKWASSNSFTLFNSSKTLLSIITSALKAISSRIPSCTRGIIFWRSKRIPVFSHSQQNSYSYTCSYKPGPYFLCNLKHISNAFAAISFSYIPTYPISFK